MTREQYIRMTEATRRAADRLPGGARALRAPTLLCAAIYCASLLYLMFTGDGRIVRAVLVPAACFAVVTALRPLLGKHVRNRIRIVRRELVSPEAVTVVGIQAVPCPEPHHQSRILIDAVD